MRLFLLAAFWAAFSCSVQAAPLCLPPDVMAARLAARFGEHPAHSAMTPRGALLTVYRSRDGRSWTITIEAHGRACLISAGQEWRDLEWREEEGA